MTAIAQITAATANELDTIIANGSVTPATVEQALAAFEYDNNEEESANDDPEGSSGDSAERATPRSSIGALAIGCIIAMGKKAFSSSIC